MRRQKTAGAAVARRFQAMNRPPAEEGGFFWFTSDMLNSPAWKAMPLHARLIVEGIVSEHMDHAATANGELIVTYENFMERGVRRQSIPVAIRIAEGLGWIDVTFHGGRSYGNAHNPSTYGLTWLPRCDGTSASRRWKRVKSDEEAKAIIKAAAAPRRTSKIVPLQQIAA